jgi:hypothetical protein
MAVFPACHELPAAPREIHRIQRVVMLLDRKERLEGGNMVESHIAAAGYIESYASAVTKILLLPSHPGFHLCNPELT